MAQEAKGRCFSNACWLFGSSDGTHRLPLPLESCCSAVPPFMISHCSLQQAQKCGYLIHCKYNINFSLENSLKCLLVKLILVSHILIVLWLAFL